MKRDEALLKLLALEAETRVAIRLQCGWPHGVADEVLTKLVMDGLVIGKNGKGGRRYRPTRAGMRRFA